VLVLVASRSELASRALSVEVPVELAIRTTAALEPA
jgi:hypothetical protein